MVETPAGPSSYSTLRSRPGLILSAWRGGGAEATQCRDQGEAAAVPWGAPASPEGALGAQPQGGPRWGTTALLCPALPFLLSWPPQVALPQQAEGIRGSPSPGLGLGRAPSRAVPCSQQQPSAHPMGATGQPQPWSSLLVLLSRYAILPSPRPCLALCHLCQGGSHTCPWPSCPPASGTCSPL